MVVSTEKNMPSCVEKKRAEIEKNSINSIQHYAMFYPEKFEAEPVKKMGVIQNYFKRNPYPTPSTLEQIANAFCAGQTLMLANVELTLKDQADKVKADLLDGRSKDWLDLHIMSFKSTQLLGIDIDDEYGETNIQEVIQHFNERVAVAYYSFSHDRANDKGGTENRYRLLFQFDKSITDYNVCKEIVEIIRHELIELYPAFSSTKINIMNPKMLWHGSDRPLVYLNETAFMNASYYVEKAEKSLRGKQAALKIKRKDESDNFKKQVKNPATYEELKLACEAIGHIPKNSGEESQKKWLQIVYALKNQVNIGRLDDSQGLELYHIVSGGESTESYWYIINPNGAVTVATIFYHAKESGYKRKHKHEFALRNAPASIPVERIKVEGGIPIRLAKELLNRHERLLIDSPTGSWKTTSFMKAFKELSNENHHYFIYSAPTVALTLQTSEIHDVMAVHGRVVDLEYQVERAVNAGERVFVTTYNKTAELVSYLIANKSGATYSLVVDEVHKFATDYNYRTKEIDELQELQKSAISYIGLSGTPEDVLKEDYSKVIKIDNGNEKSPCTDFRVFTYNRMADADVFLVPVIEGLLKQTKVLVFINNIDRAKQIAGMLEERGIVTRLITSDEKSDATFKSIVEKQSIEESVQVVISTIVLADGISIDNNVEWSCLVVTDTRSPIFNPSTIKQISNRFRNKYTHFCLYMLIPTPANKEVRRYVIESSYQHSNRIVKRYTKYLNIEYKAEERELFAPSIVESDNGIRLKSEPLEIIYKPLFVRHQAVKGKEAYYTSFRNAFINEVERVLGHEAVNIFNVNEEAEVNGTELSGLFAEVDLIKEKAKQEADIKRDSFSKHFTSSIHNGFIRGDKKVLIQFKRIVHSDQYAATLLNSYITDFETCKVLGENVKRRADIKKFHNDIQALVDIAVFESVDRKTVTKRVFSELTELTEALSSADFKDLIDVVIPKRLKVARKDVKATLRMFNRTYKRRNKTRFTEITPLTVDVVAERHGIHRDSVQASIKKYVLGKRKQEREVLLKAVNEKWGASYCIEK